MKCETCQKAIRDDVRFCPYCGTPIKKSGEAKAGIPVREVKSPLKSGGLNGKGKPPKTITNQRRMRE